MNRTRAYLRTYHDRQPSERIRKESIGYRIAMEILDGLIEMGAVNDVGHDFVWSICEREGKAWEEMQGRAAG
jgi:hypothetical protein